MAQYMLQYMFLQHMPTLSLIFIAPRVHAWGGIARPMTSIRLSVRPVWRW